MPEEILFIQKNETLADAENYPLLREEGLKYLQALSGKIWTDYNIHDPGVTILELLCYAITDLAYRTRFSMADLLTRQGASKPDKTNSFYTAKEILTTHPVTIEDYRRLLIDHVPGLKNAWLQEIDDSDAVSIDNAAYFRPRTNGYAVEVNEKENKLSFIQAQQGAGKKLLHLHGLYRIKVELENWETMVADKALKSKVQKALNKVRKPGAPLVTLKKNNKSAVWEMFENLIKKTLHSYRNLCEDFETVSVMKEEQVTICADIEVQPGSDINELIKKIYRIIYNYASPSLRFYSLEEMLDKGKTIEEIYEGTVPLKGFVDYDELKTRLNRQRIVMYTSDLVNMIMDLDGVIAVKKLLLTSSDESGATIYNSEKYCLHLKDAENRSFRFRRLDADGKPANKITFFKNNLPFKAKEPGADFVMQEIKKPALFVDDLPVPGGVNRGLDDYYLIQNEFPRVYYSGADKMSRAEATRQRLNQRLQLKGYLVFFEQLLANFLAQVNNLPALFSWNAPGSINTYGYKRLDDPAVNGEGLIDFGGLEDVLSGYLAVLNDPEANAGRRNRLLDTLLARFNEKFVDYSIFKYTYNDESPTRQAQEELIKDKCTFLKRYAKISANRSHAIDINRNALLTHHLYNLSGFQQYLTSVLGLNFYEDHYLARVIRDPVTGEAILTADGKPTYIDNSNSSFDEAFGLHMIEHVLLRPLAVDKNNPGNIEFLSLCCCDDDKEPSAGDYCSDPYSMRITIVLTGWLNLSMDMEFRKFINAIIRGNAPAHIAIKICWIGMEQMYEYEQAYVAFLQWLKKRETIDFGPGNSSDISGYNTALGNFVHVINNLKNVYPPATLHDCENSERDVDGSLVNRTVILNRTTLGTTRPAAPGIIPGTESNPDPRDGEVTGPLIPNPSKKQAADKGRKTVVKKESMVKKAAPVKTGTPPKKAAAKKGGTAKEKPAAKKTVPVKAKTAKSKPAPVKKKPVIKKKK